MTILGIGYYVALLVKAEVDDVNRFRSGDHLCSYAGLVPSTHSSGGVADGLGGHGLKLLRHSITRAYHRIAKKLGKKVAVVASFVRLVRSGRRVMVPICFGDRRMPPFMGGD
jgi:transposase